MKQYNRDTFRFNLNGKEYIIKAHTENTRTGFKHLIELYQDYDLIGSNEKKYSNRTWESWEYQSVIAGLIGTRFSNEEKELIMKQLNKNEIDNINQKFENVGALCRLIGVFDSTLKEKNEMKLQTLQSTFGDNAISLPDSWNDLDEQEKETRLNRIIEFLGNNKIRE